MNSLPYPPNQARHTPPSATDARPSWSTASAPEAASPSQLTASLTIIALAALLVIRKTDAFTNPQLWAEDCEIFFRQADGEGLRAFFTPYNGYLHLIPRLIAAAAAWFHACNIPTLYNYSAAVVTVFVAARFLSPRLEVPAKVWLALAVLLVPHTGEVFVNITNLQWITALLLIQLLLARDASQPREHVIDLTTVVAVGLSGPFSVVLLPFFVLRWWQRRSMASAACAALLAACAAIQLTFIAELPSGPATPPFNLHNGLVVVAHRLLIAPLLGPWVYSQLAPNVTLAVAAALLAALLGLAWRPSPQRTIKWTLWACLAVLVASGWYKARFDTWADFDNWNGDRYFFIPKVLLLWLVGLELGSTRLVAWSARGLLAASFIFNAAQLRFTPLTDLKWHDYCHRIERGEEVRVPLHPGWDVDIAARPGGR